MRFVKLVSRIFTLAMMFLPALLFTAQAQDNFKPTRFSVVVEGPADAKTTPVILIPGLACSRAVYDGEAKLLKANYRLYRLQIAGFGGLAAGPNEKGSILLPVVQELHEYIVANHLEHSAIIGHSLGGLIALMLAEAYPEDVGKLLIIDSLPFYSVLINPDATVDNIRSTASEMRDQITIPSLSDFIARERDEVAPQLSISAVGQKAIIDQSYVSNRKVVGEAFYEDATTDMRTRIANIHAPVTVIIAYDTSMGSKKDIGTMYLKSYAAMKQTKFVMAENSRHFVMYDVPGPFHVAVTDFLKVQ